MSVLIRGWHMPKSCRECQFSGLGGVVNELSVCMLTGNCQSLLSPDRLSSCPLVEVPAQHGDLIDYNFCLKNYELLHDDDGNPVYAVRMRDINAAPTIIEAEEEDSNG